MCDVILIHNKITESNNLLSQKKTPPFLSLNKESKISADYHIAFAECQMLN